jgi:hypothetical protein
MGKRCRIWWDEDVDMDEVRGDCIDTRYVYKINFSLGDNG